MQQCISFQSHKCILNEVNNTRVFQKNSFFLNRKEQKQTLPTASAVNQYESEGTLPQIFLLRNFILFYVSMYTQQTVNVLVKRPDAT